MNMKDHINRCAKDFSDLDFEKKLGITLGDFVLDPHYWYAKNRERLADEFRKAPEDASSNQ